MMEMTPITYRITSKMRIFTVLLLVIGFFILISGCTDHSPTVEQDNHMDRGMNDELILAIGSEPEAGFDPTTGWGRYGSPLFQSTLFRRNAKMVVVNDLAVDYKVSVDGKIWTVQLREDVYFSDGEPLTAADVQYTFETAAKSGSTIDLSNLESVEQVGDYAVLFNLKEAQSTFMYMLISTGIVPKHAHGPSYAEHPIGSGPFKLLQWDRGQQLIIEANGLYYGQQPSFARMTFVFLNEDAAFAAAKSGQVDMASVPASFSQQDISGMRLESFHSVDNRGVMFPYVPSGSTTEEGYLIGNDVTADLAIRRSINIAVDR